ncbi:YtjB family periplasmic protein [Rodentibacter trehalosifermentans]|uniref:Hemolysin regulation protein AhpA n=1 Tax=Rodentibacter trehalosifermentans TaxID=1908263 RepID=A0A1V3J1M4_9PAST|nr:YtjB family periplasmic protein [Rodentibacter trehalosifermentans]OOF48725.1 hemolysin regulation protein AhpA [Rodentibacter trehalosifermentans]OOF52707.1 hemolysin regulation protein AhpA [Rodentibacter trehalosifermentans]
MHLIKDKLTKSVMLVLILFLCLGAMAVILFGVQQFKIGSQLASVNQVSNLSHILVRQQTNLFSVLLMNNAKMETLTENLDNLVREHFVLDASIYNSQGKLLAQSTDSESLRKRLGLEKQDEAQNTQQVVEPVYSNLGIQGFLRVTFDGQYAQSSQSKINQIFLRLYGELIIVFLLGVVLASSIHYFLSHYRRAYRLSHEPQKAVNLPVKSNIQRYNQRRRRG